MVTCPQDNVVGSLPSCPKAMIQYIHFSVHYFKVFYFVQCHSSISAAKCSWYIMLVKSSALFSAVNVMSL